MKSFMTKSFVIVMLGMVLWTDGGLIKEAKAQLQNCGDGGYTTVIDGALMCMNGSAGLRPYGSHPDDGYGPRQSGGGNNSGANGGFGTPSRQKPSSYGAVAWGNGYYGSASKQPTKQASIDLALQRCGNQACKVNVNYSNQCVALSYGKLSNGKYRWTPAFGITC